MKSEQIEKDVREIVSTVLEIPIKDIDPDADFVKDFGMDSMGALEILASIEKKYKKAIPEEEIMSMKTLNKTIEVTKKVLNVV